MVKIKTTIIACLICFVVGGLGFLAVSATIYSGQLEQCNLELGRSQQALAEERNGNRLAQEYNTELGNRLSSINANAKLAQGTIDSIGKSTETASELLRKTIAGLKLISGQLQSILNDSDSFRWDDSGNRHRIFGVCNSQYATPDSPSSPIHKPPLTTP